MTAPRYPVYVPSKGRVDSLTGKMFEKDGVPWRFVVQPPDTAAYTERWGAERVLTLPDAVMVAAPNMRLVYARNWIKDHATAAGHERHWQFDDDVSRMSRLERGYRVPCDAAVALTVAEDFVDRYSNVGLASFNSEFFVRNAAYGFAAQVWPPFYLNARCYTCFLVRNDELRFTGPYNEDTDMTLQVIAHGDCTILFNAFLMWTPTSVTDHTGKGAKKGGQTDIYVGEGRLHMARALERRFPGIVEVRRRFGRAQHYVKFHWRKFDTPLQLRPGAKPLPDYGLELNVVGEGRREEAARTRDRILGGEVIP